MGNTTWRSACLNVEKLSNELWVGVKSQSNLEIAGSPRNSFRTSLGVEIRGGRALDGLGVIPSYQTQPNCEYHELYPGVRQWGISLIAARETAQTVS